MLLPRDWSARWLQGQSSRAGARFDDNVFRNPIHHPDHGYLPTLAGHGLQSGQPIKLLTELSLGPHTFTVKALDNVRNASSKSVTFTIIVTAQSIIDDVTEFVTASAITQNEGTSLLAKLLSAKRAREAGNCPNATTIYQFIHQRGAAQSGITAAAATILIADARYLIAHCP